MSSNMVEKGFGKVGLAARRSCHCFCDSSSAIKLSKNPVMHGRTKHIDVRFHFLRELTKDGSVLKLEQFLKLRKYLGVCSIIDIN